MPDSPEIIYFKLIKYYRHKFFRFPYRYTVFDNSTDEAKASEIACVCRRHDTAYIRLPRQEFLPKGRGSYSHGIACNYLFNNYIQIGG